MFRTLHRKQMVVTKSLGILVGDWASANISSLCTHLTRSSYRGKSKLKFYVPHAASIQSHGFLLTLPLGITFNKLRGLDEMPGTDLGLAKYKAVVFCAVLSLHSYLLFSFFFLICFLFIYLFVFGNIQQCSCLILGSELSDQFWEAQEITWSAGDRTHVSQVQSKLFFWSPLKGSLFLFSTL